MLAKHLMLNVAAKKSSDKDRVYKETCTLLGVTPKKNVGKPAEIDVAKRAVAMSVAEAVVGGSEAFSDNDIYRLLHSNYPQFALER